MIRASKVYRSLSSLSPIPRGCISFSSSFPSSQRCKVVRALFAPLASMGLTSSAFRRYSSIAKEEKSSVDIAAKQSVKKSKELSESELIRSILEEVQHESKHRKEKELPSDGFKQFRGRMPSVDVTKKDLDELEQLKLEIPEALEYKLHTMDEIPDGVVRTFMSHTKIHKYAAVAEGYTLEKERSDLEEKLREDILGTCLYIRVISLDDKDSMRPTKCKFKPFAPLDEKLENVFDLGLNRRIKNQKRSPFFLYHHPRSTPSHLTESQRAATEKVRGVLNLHFSSRVLEPIEGELTCDVSLYAKYRVLFEKATTYVRQYRKDLDNILSEKCIKRFDHYGHCISPSEKALEPLLTEEVIVRLCAFLKSSIFPSGLRSGKKAENSDLRVVIGAARSALQAKMACDIEVAKTLEDSRSSARRRGSLFRVRSFCKHLKTMEDERRLVGVFKLEQIPTVSIEFARFMKTVFQVELVSQIYEKRNELHFSLCKSTFEFLYRIALGRGEFPHEVHRPLFSTRATFSQEKLLLECASNRISFFNDQRTAIRVSVPRLSHGINPGVLAMGFTGQKLFGRLSSDAKYVEKALEAAVSPIELLLDSRCAAGAISVEERCNYYRVAYEAVSFPTTADHRVFLKIVKQLAQKMAKKRVKESKFLDKEETFVLVVRLLQIDSLNLLPSSLEEGIDAVMASIKEAFQKRRTSHFSLRKILQSGVLYQENRTRAVSARRCRQRKNSNLSKQPAVTKKTSPKDEETKSISSIPMRRRGVKQIAQIRK